LRSRHPVIFHRLVRIAEIELEGASLRSKWQAQLGGDPGSPACARSRCIISAADGGSAAHSGSASPTSLVGCSSDGDSRSPGDRSPLPSASAGSPFALMATTFKVGLPASPLNAAGTPAGASIAAAAMQAIARHTALPSDGHSWQASKVMSEADTAGGGSPVMG